MHSSFQQHFITSKGHYRFTKPKNASSKDECIQNARFGPDRGGRALLLLPESRVLKTKDLLAKSLLSISFVFSRENTKILNFVQIIAKLMYPPIKLRLYTK